MKVGIVNPGVLLIKFVKVKKKSAVLIIDEKTSARLGVVIDGMDELKGKIVVFKDMDWLGMSLPTVGELVFIDKSKVFAVCELEDDDVIEVYEAEYQNKKFNPYGADAEWNGYLDKAAMRTSFLVDMSDKLSKR